MRRAAIAAKNEIALELVARPGSPPVQRGPGDGHLDRPGPRRLVLAGCHLEVGIPLLVVVPTRIEAGAGAVDDEMENTFEAWYGSMALLKAAARVGISHDEVLDRISDSLYGQAALMLDDNAVNSIAILRGKFLYHLSPSFQ